MEEQKHTSDSHSQEVEMHDSSLADPNPTTAQNLRSLKIKSIDGQTYELTVPKDVRLFDFL